MIDRRETCGKRWRKKRREKHKRKKNITFFVIYELNQSKILQLKSFNSVKSPSMFLTTHQMTYVAYYVTFILYHHVCWDATSYLLRQSASDLSKRFINTGANVHKIPMGIEYTISIVCLLFTSINTCVLGNRH